MASTIVLAERKMRAAKRFETTCQAFANSLNAELPAPSVYTNQLELGFVQHLERMADLMELIQAQAATREAVL